MSVLTPAELAILVPSQLTTAQAQFVIDMEEAFIARILGTALAGERTQNIWRWTAPTLPNALEPMGRDPNDLFLLRPTDAIAAVVDNGVTLDPSTYRLLQNGCVVERADAGWTGPLITVRYTPNDTLELKRVIIECARVTMTSTGFYAERIGEYNYERAPRMPFPIGAIDVASKMANIRTLQVNRPTYGTVRLQPRETPLRYGPIVVPS